jgi:hypothetical protein
MEVSPEQLRRERARHVRQMRDANREQPDLFNIEAGFTCDACSLAPTCAYAFDLYNTDGDCISSK